MAGKFQRLELSGPWKFPGFGSGGFTLLELLVVLLIIGILISLGTGGYSLARRSAKEGQAKADIELLRNALEEYRVEYGSYPPSVGPVAVVTNVLSPFVNGDLQSVDPWGRPYLYSTNRFGYSVFSQGIDPEDDADNIDPSRAGYGL
ncbi:type II secretion system protein GspG [Pontiella agarivorans]|uniref:Type II secretion system protein GspG n=1 Tax=Pontiella agarivorans TaxID=3038953 RepID=A0ABU5MYQ3_9BACT|nr:type II secretion system protein GspG [Pontiella agarivorans]MDZ8119322.1 type II secretion system protein GspG [Pontiella agarivorans]